MDASLLKRIDDLERRKLALKKELDDIEKNKSPTEQQAQRKATLGRELEALTRDSDKLVGESGGR
jgi:predicted  nucleic acid-binding Zn-ribbon protein